MRSHFPPSYSPRPAPELMTLAATMQEAGIQPRC